MQRQFTHDNRQNGLVPGYLAVISHPGRLYSLAIQTTLAGLPGKYSMIEQKILDSPYSLSK